MLPKRSPNLNEHWLDSIYTSRNIFDGLNLNYNLSIPKSAMISYSSVFKYFNDFFHVYDEHF